MNTISLVEIERSLLCTLLFAYMISDEHIHTLEPMKLSGDTFTDSFHKVTLRALQHIYKQGLLLTDETVIALLAQYNQLDEQKMLLITTHNWLGAHTYKQSCDVLTENANGNLLQGL